MPVTTKQIAELAGVSRGTVDRVLNGRPGVSAENRRRVREIADKLGYVPNRAGKALSTSKRPISVGIVLNCVDNPFYDDVIRGMENCRSAYAEFNTVYRYRRLKGYAVAEQLDALEALSDCQAILISPLNDPAVAGKIDSLWERGVPVGTVNNDIENSRRLFHVGCDYVASGRTAGGLTGLLSGESGRVGIVTGSLGMLGHRQRVEGFLSVLREEYPGLSHAWTLENGDDDARSYELVLRRLGGAPDITAVYFGAAGQSGGVRAVEEACGSALPVIVTCDDIPRTRELILRGVVKATVCQEPFRQGYEAVRMALDYCITGRSPAPDTAYMKNEIKIAHNL